MVKRLSAVAIQALKEALCKIYWYKDDLRSFIKNCISESNIVNEVDWTVYKRQIVADIVDLLCADQDKYLGDLRRLLHEVCKMSNFKHLEHLEDGKHKSEQAALAVQALRELVETHDQKIKEQSKSEQRRKEAMVNLKSKQAITQKLDEIKDKYFKLVTSKCPQTRGYELEQVMHQIFELFDLDPKASFRNIGEQIDGAFSLEGTDYLFEAKWTKHKLGSEVLDSFKGKVNRKLDNTLGLFLSINGFSKDAISIHSNERSTILLMDGSDLVVVLEGRVDFVSLIVRKRRHAAQTGNIFYHATQDL